MNIENLQKLSKYLRTVDQQRFTMKVFSSTIPRLSMSQLNQLTDCGTAGCAVGHAPLAGIPKHSTESWVAYSCRVFDIGRWSVQWSWMFEEIWAYVDNTPGGAADRIDHLIDNPDLMWDDDWRQLSAMMHYGPNSEVMAEDLKDFLVEQGLEHLIKPEGQYERHF